MNEAIEIFLACFAIVGTPDAEYSYGVGESVVIERRADLSDDKMHEYVLGAFKHVEIALENDNYLCSTFNGSRMKVTSREEVFGA